MIPRYSRPEMVRIWEPENRFRIWYEIEALALEAQAELGIAPKRAAKALRRAGRQAMARITDAKRIEAIEQETRHDVVAFLANLVKAVGPDGRFIHQGLTSSDVLDTGLSLQLVQAADILLAGQDRLMAALERRAFEHKTTPCVGRSHGIHAEPMTLGLKFASFHAESARNRARLEAARREIGTCAISGPVGTFSSVDPRIEARVADALGLVPEPISTQVIPRDRHAMFFATLAVIASSLERLAVEIRHLQRTEVREAEEYFAAGQKGSSAMPHKRNPVLSENVTGLARLIRSAVIPALENVALWHERDISHSSVERVIAPDATIALDFALHRMAGIVEKLVIYPEAMRRNLDALGGLIYSQAVLLALIQTGLSREEAYKVVQRNAMKVWREGGAFRERLEADPAVHKALPSDELAQLFEPAPYLEHVGTIFKRVFGRTRRIRPKTKKKK